MFYYSTDIFHVYKYISEAVRSVVHTSGMIHIQWARVEGRRERVVVRNGMEIIYRRFSFAVFFFVFIFKASYTIMVCIFCCMTSKPRIRNKDDMFAFRILLLLLLIFILLLFLYFILFFHHHCHYFLFYVEQAERARGDECTRRKQKKKKSRNKCNAAM